MARNGVMPPLIVAAGALVGLLYGIFGVGSAFATPALALMGVPGMAAVVGPLPALLPGSAAGAWSYHRSGRVDRPLAVRVIASALPAAVVGAFVSQWLGGTVLVLASAGIAFVVGVRIVVETHRTANTLRTPDAERDLAAANVHLARRTAPLFVPTMAVLVGFASGLLANAGGFLLVPLFLLMLGLDRDVAAGTSLVVATVLTIPILATHILVGELAWLVAIPFAIGLVPATYLGGRLAPRLPTHRLQGAFGVLMVGLAAYLVVKLAIA